jgi:APA family basic amino acid/polyamine antiporter
MLGVLLNLLIGLSRVLLAMGRRGDMPARLARLNGAGTTPTAAVVAVGLGVAALTLLDDVMATWSLSAFAVLIYYGITNVAALRLDARERFVPRVVAVAGLAACLFLVVWIEELVMIAGAVVIAAGLVWRFGYRRVTARSEPPRFP